MIPIGQLAGEIVPERTVLLFGAGSSVPSKAPSVATIMAHFEEKFGVKSKGYTLRELSSLVEAKTHSRKRMIGELRKLFDNLRPTGGLLNIPLYNWKSIFTTNFDRLIEDCYERRGIDLSAFSSNFDFTLHDNPTAVKLFKLHGTIEKDVSDGHVSRIIITDTDYDQTEDYRQNLFDRLKSDLAGAHLVIIGHSLADPDIKEVVARAASINSQTMGSGRISLLLYEKDDDRALLYENRGIDVCFSGIDEFFAEFSRRWPPSAPKDLETDDPLSRFPPLSPVTVDVKYEFECGHSDVSAMFNGWPATYGDVAAGLTFQRSIAPEIDDYLNGEGVVAAIIVGAMGVGKTTAARQAMLRFHRQGKLCWEHKGDHPLSVAQWSEVMATLQEKGLAGVLFIDDASAHLQQVNDLIDRAVLADNAHLKFVLSATRNHWYPRIKTANLYRYGKEWVLSQLRNDEIERLLQLIDTNDRIRPLVEPMFSGFSKHERRRRLVDRCEKDFFVCLKNIFATDSLDDIILREFAGLSHSNQEIYRYVAAMENAGVKVHRQLVIRLLGIRADSIAATLNQLTDIIHEYDVDTKEGIYGWRSRHSVIAGIVTKYKFSDTEKMIALFERVIDAIRPTFDIEIRTIRDLCNIDTGLPRIPDKEVQNRLLRRLMSVAPGERVPRHRLIRNLIDGGAFEKAEAEIRIFNKDFGPDGPVYRYRVNLMVARAMRSPGLLEEDRIAILRQAQELAVAGAEKYANNKNMLSAYVELGIAYYKKTAHFDFYEDAMARMKLAEEQNGDPEISKTILRY
ncbi:MAG: SIR2 family NAD-dependent protein deacylase [Roseiarcus sp.]